MATFHDITYAVDGAAAIVTINRPERYNAFRAKTVEEMIKAFRAAWADRQVQSVILTGAGEKAFCTGGDVKQRAETGDYGPSESGMFEIGYLHKLIRDIPKPVIAGVNGVAATDGHAIDPGDDGLRDIADQLVQVADLEHAALARAVVAGLGALLDVTAGAEGLLAGAGKDDRLDLPVRPGGAERLDHLLDRLRAEGVVALRAVDRDDRGRAVDRVGDVVKGRHPGPLLATPQQRGEYMFTWDEDTFNRAGVSSTHLG